MSKKNSHKGHNSSKIKYSKHKTEPILEVKPDLTVNLMSNQEPEITPNQKNSKIQESKTQETDNEIVDHSNQIPDKELQAVVERLNLANDSTESSVFKSVNQAFISKHFSVLMVSILLLVVAFASILLYLLNQPKSTTTAPELPSSDQTKPKVSESQIEAINKLAISPDFPGLEKFSFVLNKGSALPIGQIDLDKRADFIAGTEATLASDFDELGQRMALVQSVALYQENTAQKLNIKDYTQKDFQKLECGDVADECALFYKPSVNTVRPIDAYRLYFRKQDFVFYFEFAKNDKHPEFDQNWLKKIANDLAAKVN